MNGPSNASSCLADDVPLPDRYPSPPLRPAVERDFMGICLDLTESATVKPDMALTPFLSGTAETSDLLFPISDPAHDLCGSHLKLGLPSSNADENGDSDPCSGELFRCSVGWPPISSYRKSATGSLAMKSPCQHEGIVERLPLVYLQAPVIADNEFVKDECNSSHQDLANNENQKIILVHRPIKLRLIKVSVDGIPIMRKLNLETMQGYPHLTLELHKLFKFYKRDIACKVALCLKESDGADYILTYKERIGHWMPIGNTPWETFLHRASRLRIMKKGKCYV